jgi:hypothetical protein
MVHIDDSCIYVEFTIREFQDIQSEATPVDRPLLARTDEVSERKLRERILLQLTAGYGARLPIHNLRMSVAIGGKPENMCSL